MGIGTRRMKPVLHIVPALFSAQNGVLGGAERYAFELARNMAEVVPTVLLAFGARAERKREGELEIVVARARRVRGERQNPWSPAVLSWIRRARIVHCHQRSVLVSSIAALAGRLLGRPTFVTDLGGGGWDVSAYLDTTSWFSGHLHISEFSRRVYGHQDRADARVIGGGVDLAKFRPNGSARRDGGALYVGRLLPHKGVDQLIEAAGAGFPLTILGMPYDGRYLADLHRLAEGKNVEFVHGASDDKLVSAYCSASVVVAPSVYRTCYGDETPLPELLGQSALEGAACGAPVVCTDVGSLPEVVADGETGFIVPPNDPKALGERVLWLSEHPTEAAQMGMAGRRRVEVRFSWRSVVRRCLDIYGIATAEERP